MDRRVQVQPHRRGTQANSKRRRHTHVGELRGRLSKCLFYRTIRWPFFLFWSQNELTSCLRHLLELKLSKYLAYCF
jgi:hypothetical protein